MAAEKLAADVSNWGRWGKDDQRGALNLITPDVVKQAAQAVRSVREGSTASLSLLKYSFFSGVLGPRFNIISLHLFSSAGV